MFTALLRYGQYLKSTYMKFLLLILISFSYFIFFTPSALAQVATTSALPATNYQQQTPTFSPQSPHTASLAIYNFTHALSCILMGQSAIAPCLDYKIFKDTQGIITSVPVLNKIPTGQGLFGVGTSVLSGLYSTPPLKSSEYIAGLGREMGLVKEANAQVGGSGNSVLSPVYKLWEVSRNIAYLTMIIIFLVVGFMVMFRQRLNPQTVVTVQLALPSLVIGLVLITFSYFMASLITDIAFLGTDLVGYFFQAAQTGPNSPGSLTQLLASENSLSIMSRLTSGLSSISVKSGIDTVINNLTGMAQVYVQAAITFITYQYGGQFTSAILGPAGGVLGFIMGAGSRFSVAGAGSAVGGVVGQLGGGILSSVVAAAAPGAILSALVGFVMVIMMIVTMFKLILKLINNFLSIIFYTIFSPFIFLVASLPGRQGLVTDWIKNLLCNVLAFPAVVGVLYFCYYLLTGGQPLSGDQPFTVSTISPVAVTGRTTLPLFGGLDLNIINALLAFGAFLATPSIPEIVCKAIGKIGPAAGMIENQIVGAQRSSQGYARQAAAAPGQVSKDISGVKGLADEKGIDLISREYRTQKYGAANILWNRGVPPPPRVVK